MERDYIKTNFNNTKRKGETNEDVIQQIKYFIAQDQVIKQKTTTTIKYNKNPKE